VVQSDVDRGVVLGIEGPKACFHLLEYCMKFDEMYLGQSRSCSADGRSCLGHVFVGPGDDACMLSSRLEVTYPIM
jgi:hypothetical protein